MTNKPTNPEEKCTICKGYDYFTSLAKHNDVKEAFHDAVDFIMESVIDELTEDLGREAYSTGFKDGFAQAHKAIGEQMLDLAELLEEDDECDCYEPVDEDECDCDECQLENKIRRDM